MCGLVSFPALIRVNVRLDHDLRGMLTAPGHDSMKVATEAELIDHTSRYYILLVCSSLPVPRVAVKMPARKSRVALMSRDQILTRLLSEVFLLIPVTVVMEMAVSSSRSCPQKSTLNALKLAM